MAILHGSLGTFTQTLADERRFTLAIANILLNNGLCPVTLVNDTGSILYLKLGDSTHLLRLSSTGNSTGIAAYGFTLSETKLTDTVTQTAKYVAAPSEYYYKLIYTAHGLAMYVYSSLNGFRRYDFDMSIVCFESINIDNNHMWFVGFSTTMLLISGYNNNTLYNMFKNNTYSLSNDVYINSGQIRLILSASTFYPTRPAIYAMPMLVLGIATSFSFGVYEIATDIGKKGTFSTGKYLIGDSYGYMTDITIDDLSK